VTRFVSTHSSTGNSLCSGSTNTIPFEREEESVTLCSRNSNIFMCKRNQISSMVEPRGLTIHSAQTAGTVAYKLGRQYDSTTFNVTSSVIESQCSCTEPIDIRLSTVNGSGRFLDILFVTRNCSDRTCG
jgi:hypothetical protein